MATIVVDLERRLAVSTAEARAALVRTLRAQEFTITAEQVSMVTAKRGSQIAGSVQPKKLPVTFHAQITPADGGGCTVTVRISDAWRSVGGKVWGMNGPYRTVMASIEAALDKALGPLAAAGTTFAPGAITSTTRDVALLEGTNAGVLRGGGAVAGKVDELFTPASAQATPKALKEVVLRSSKGVASFDRMGVEGLVTVGLLVSGKPGSMPPNLARDVETLSAKLESRIATQPSGRVVCELSDEEIPVAEFLAKQATIREGLPLRTLHVCTTCKFEKVVNPDYETLREKNRRKQALTGAVGATVSTGGVRPFLLVGSLLRLKNFDIPFVCPRCQGLEADSSVVTYCPNCGERRDEPVLRTCRRCKHDFGAAHRGHAAALWGPEPAPMPALVPVPPAALGAPTPSLALLPGPLTSPFAAPLATPAAALGALPAAAAGALASPSPARGADPAAGAGTTTSPVSDHMSGMSDPMSSPEAGAAAGRLAPPAPAWPAAPASPTEPRAGSPAPPFAVPSAAAASGARTPAGWYADTTGRHQHRYWDGTHWTAHVADNGVGGHDPV